MKRASLWFIVAFLTLMSGCSSEPTKPAAENKPAETKPDFQPTYATGREALQKMYIAARSWQADAKPYRLESLATKNANGQDGKAGLWQAGFASPGKRQVKMFSWSGIKAEGAPEPGIESRPSDTYNPANTYTQIFDIAFLKKDSSDAFEVAQKHGGDKITKKKSDTEIFYILEWDGRGGKLFWRVLYGASRDPQLAVDVDASTGLYLKVEK